jgi:hypothetical protein
MREQRNPYKGSPLRPWVRLVLVSADGTSQALDVLADTGNPCALIVSQELLKQFNIGLAPGMSTNFGPLEGGWLKVQIPEIDWEQTVLAYGSNAVWQAAQESHADFQGLAGLPLLQHMEYGGDAASFWVRS